MAKEDIEKWVAERLKTPDGKWITTPSPFDTDDVMFCILCCLENRALFSGSEMIEEYQALVDTAKNYILETKNIDRSRLKETVESDVKSYFSFRPQLTAYRDNRVRRLIATIDSI